MTPSEKVLIDSDGGVAAADKRQDFEVTGFGDTETVRINFVDGDDEDFGVEDGTVTLPSTDGDAEFDGTDVTLSNVRVDGTLIAGATETTDIDVSDASALTFRVTVTDDADGRRVPVVFAPDADGELPVGDDGEPTNAFGVGGVITFLDELTVDFAAASQDQELAIGADATFAIELAGDLDGEVSGVEVRYRVSTEADDAFGAIDPDDLYASGAVTTDADGEASFTVAAPGEAAFGDDDDITYSVALEVQGFGDDLGQTNVEWSKADLAADGLEFAEELAFSEVGSSYTATVTVVDQFGDAFTGLDDGAVVRFNDGEDLVNEDVEVAADGTASVTWVNNVNGGTTLTADLLDDNGDPITDTAEPAVAIDATAAVWWWTAADEEDVAKDDVAVVRGADFDNTLIYVEITADGTSDRAETFVLAFDWTEADAFEITDGAAPAGDFADLLADLVDPNEAPDTDVDSLETRNYQQTGTTVFNLFLDAT